MEFRTRFTKNDNKPKLICKEQGRTHQSFKAECDINTIMAKYQKTGQLPAMIKTNPHYGDFSTHVDYQESLNVVMKAQEQFDALPAKVRERFGNNPIGFLEFTNDPRNAKELIEMGLATENPTSHNLRIEKEKTRKEEKEKSDRKQKGEPKPE